MLIKMDFHYHFTTATTIFNNNYSCTTTIMTINFITMNSLKEHYENHSFNLC